MTSPTNTAFVLFRDRARLVVLPPPCPQHVQPIDFSRAAALTEQALADSRAFLDALGDGQAAMDPSLPAERLRPHTHP